MLRRALICLFLLTIPAVLGAQEAAETTAMPKAPMEEKTSVTKHVLSLNGADIPYTATAGNMLLKSEQGETQASVFYISYTRDGVEDPSSRPVMFSFNGGPGAAALWVNLGAFGPKKVEADDEGNPLPPPGRLIDNPYSILDVTDLVFIDPVGTGLSRVAEGVDRALFHGQQADVRSVGEIIRLWTTRNDRWASPKFLAGESYGTTRAAGLADHLQRFHGMYLNGIVMISTILHWQIDFHIGNDMPHILHLPSYTATAWYHKRLPPSLQERPLRDVLDEAERFALTDYALALLQGDNLSDDEHRAMAEKLAAYTGLSADFIQRANLRIELGRFRKELRRDEGITVGRLDSRFTGYDLDAAGERPEYDASMTAVDIGYVTLMNDHIGRELEYDTDLRYRSLAWEVHPWNWEDARNRHANVSEDLRRAMVQNPDMKVLFTAGYYDFATPYFDTDYTVDHMGLPKHLRSNIAIEYYEAGHMMYIRKVDHEKFRDDVVELIRWALNPR